MQVIWKNEGKIIDFKKVAFRIFRLEQGPTQCGPEFELSNVIETSNGSQL